MSNLREYNLWMLRNKVAFNHHHIPLYQRQPTPVAPMDLRLYWETTLIINGVAVFKFPVQGGLRDFKSIQWVPGMDFTERDFQLCLREANTGQPHKFDPATGEFVPRPMWTYPSVHDLFNELIRMMDVLDYRSFEAWAEGYMLDPDSRKAEASWLQHLKGALVMRNCFNEQALNELYRLNSQFY